MQEANFRLIDGCVNCHFVYVGYTVRNDPRQAPDIHEFCRKEIIGFKIGGICDLYKTFNKEELFRESEEKENAYNKFMNRLDEFVGKIV